MALQGYGEKYCMEFQSQGACGTDQDTSTNSWPSQILPRPRRAALFEVEPFAVDNQPVLYAHCIARTSLDILNF